MYMTYTYHIFKRLALFLSVSLLALSCAYAGGSSPVIRGDPATISWSVSNGTCFGSTNYTSSSDTIRNDWNVEHAASGNTSLPKVTAGAGTYTFDCIVPAGVGGCDGQKNGPQNTCWDTVILNVSGCGVGTIWDTNASSATYLTCAVQVCTPSALTVYGCAQTDPNGTLTHMCSADGLSASGACVHNPGTGGDNNGCAGGYALSGGPSGTCQPIICSPNASNIATGCVQSDPNGTMVHTCNGTGTGYVEPSCLPGVCNAGYTLVGNSCQPITCPNGENNPPTCTQCPDGQAWSGASCVPCNGTCSGVGGTHANPKGGLICNNGAVSASVPACDVCPSGKNYISNSCVVPGLATNGTLAAADCAIALSGTTCTTVISFNTINTNSVRVENCTNNTVIAPSIGGGARTLPATTIAFGSTCLKLIDNNTNIVLSNASVNAICNTAQNLTWYGGKCASSVSCSGNGCSNAPNCNSGTDMNYFSGINKCLSPKAQFTVATKSCTISTNQSGCYKVLTWSSQNVFGTSLYDQSPTGHYASFAGEGNQTYNINGGVYVPYGNGTYRIIDKDAQSGGNGTGIVLDTITITAACASSDVWNGSKCVLKTCTPNSITTSGCTQSANSVITRTCDALGIAYGSCTLTGCQPGYHINGLICDVDPCPTTGAGSGCNNPPSCNSAPGKNFITGMCLTPSISGAISAPDCKIANNKSSCISRMSFTTINTNSVKIETCANGILINQTPLAGGLQTYDVTVNGTGDSTTICYRLADASNSVVISTKNITANCDTGLIWLGGKCRVSKCNNGCTNTPDCNNRQDFNFFAIPLPDGLCKAPSGNFTNSPTCQIQIGRSGCNVDLSWASVDTVAVTLEDTITPGGYGTGYSVGPHIVTVTVPYGGGDYRILDVTTSGSVIPLRTVHLISTIPLGTEWDGSKVVEKLSLTPIIGTRYLGMPYTITWDTNAAATDISYNGNVVAANVTGHTYDVTGIPGNAPALNDNTNSLFYGLLAHKQGLTSISGVLETKLIYKAKAIFGDASSLEGIVTLPLTCKNAIGYNLKDSVGTSLMSIPAGLDKNSITNVNYTCPLSSCPSGKVTLNCINNAPDLSDFADYNMNLTDFMANVINFSVSPSTVQSGSLNNKITINWSMTNHDHCYVRVKADPESYLNMTQAQKDMYMTTIKNEASDMYNKIKNTGGMYPIGVNKSKDATAGSNVITGVKSTYSKIFSLVCGDINNDGVPDGLYANLPIKTVKLRVGTVSEQ